MLKDCDDDDDMTVEDVRKRMAPEGVHVGLTGGGDVQITWSFAADVMYVCSVDYLSHGSGTSSLLPGAKPLGLSGPLPAGLTAAFADIGAVHTVGWSHLSLEGDARAKALAAFEEAPVKAWGRESFSDQPAEGAAATGDAAAAVKALGEARKLTRAKKYADAIAAFDKATALDPKLAAAFSGRGYAHMLAGELDPAQADFDTALTLDSAKVFQAQVHYNLGAIAEKRHDPEAAKASYTKSLELRPNDAVEKALARLNDTK